MDKETEPKKGYDFSKVIDEYRNPLGAKVKETMKKKVWKKKSCGKKSEITKIWLNILRKANYLQF